MLRTLKSAMKSKRECEESERRLNAYILPLVLFCMATISFTFLLEHLLFDTNYMLRKQENYVEASGDRKKLFKDLSLFSIATGGYNAVSLLQSFTSPGLWPLYSSKEQTVLLSDFRSLESNLQGVDDLYTLYMVNNTHSAMEAKVYKSKVFDYVNTDLVLFFDADIQAMNNMRSYMQEVYSLGKNWYLPCDVYMNLYPLWPIFPRSEYFSLLVGSIADYFELSFSIWNSGNFLAHRTYSRHFLSAWKDAVESGNFKFDQNALRYIQKKYGYKFCPLPDDSLLPASLNGKVNKYLYKYTFSHETSSTREKKRAIRNSV
eukprot:augustus_masked-scaffold_4-processed-gene-7.20-mRNA-1 protein AED:1.00 eAED:1.00 QI:0/-1/0/0/-1/1/1/0/316